MSKEALQRLERAGGMIQLAMVIMATVFGWFNAIQAQQNKLMLAEIRLELVQAIERAAREHRADFATRNELGNIENRVERLESWTRARKDW